MSRNARQLEGQVDRQLLSRALKALGRRERTVAEMRAWLAKRTEDPDAIERVISFLSENLALDDVRFSHAFAEDKRELAGWGAERIEATLRRRGIDADLAREASIAGAQTEIERALRVLQDRIVQVDTDRDRGRALGLLARRGYSIDDAYAAVRRLRPGTD